MSKIVVIVRGHVKIGENEWQNEIKEYENASAFNNERGELIITKKTRETTSKEQRNSGQKIVMGTIAVFKDWVYWEKID